MPQADSFFNGESGETAHRNRLRNRFSSVSWRCLVEKRRSRGNKEGVLNFFHRRMMT